MSISLNYEYLLTEQGLTEGLLHEELSAAESVYGKVSMAKKAGDLGFTKLPYQNTDDLAPLIHLADQVASECKSLIVVGIGGSDLGARAIHRALNHQFYNLYESARSGRPKLFFLGDTTDPVAIREVLDVVDLEQTTIVVISKSGNTVEQMSTFIYLRELLVDMVGSDVSKKRIIILTDAATGTLREIVDEEGYRSLPIPSDVGGRFSALCSVGLFPLAVAGIDVKGILEGAAEMDAHDNAGASGNMALLYAVTQMWYYQNGRPISVLMPYTYGLREVGFWFRQLWAESLGKKQNLRGEDVYVGPTPIAAVGPTDQHSQVQLYMEGPKDKVITFLTVENPATNMVLPEAFAHKEGVRYLKGHNFTEILSAEQKSTAYALANAGRPSCTISVTDLSPRTIGQILYFFELATAYAGALLEVNTYDQPGVEIGKQYMYGLLGRPGFEDKQVADSAGTHVITF